MGLLFIAVFQSPLTAKLGMFTLYGKPSRTTSTQTRNIIIRTLIAMEIAPYSRNHNNYCYFLLQRTDLQFYDQQMIYIVRKIFPRSARSCSMDIICVSPFNYYIDVSLLQLRKCGIAGLVIFLSRVICIEMFERATKPVIVVIIVVDRSLKIMNRAFVFFWLLTQLSA